MTNLLDLENVDSAPIFDQSKIDTLVMAIGQEKASEFAIQYIDSCVEQSKLLYKAIEEQDFKQIEFHSHKLASGAGTFGNEKLHRMLLYIEGYSLKTVIATPLDTETGFSDFQNLVSESMQLLRNYLDQ